MEQVKGIEPSYQAWEARVLPLNYTCTTLVTILAYLMKLVNPKHKSCAMLCFGKAQKSLNFAKMRKKHMLLNFFV